MKKLNVFAFVLFASCTQVTITVPAAGGHACSFEDCSQTGSTTFKSDCEEGSDCYYFDMLHFEFPKATYEELETMMWETEPEPELPKFRIS